LALADFISKFDLRLCMQCGVCTGSCPLTIRSSLNMRRLINEFVMDGGKLTGEHPELWDCTTCLTCRSRCPRGVEILDLITGLRSSILEAGRVPPTLRDALENVYKHGNPWGKSRAKRVEWISGLKIKKLEEGVKADNVLFTCCASAYDTRAQKATIALVQSLEKLNVNLGTLGEAETCCGNEVYNMGETGLFELLSEENADRLNKYEVPVITTSPHCYNAFKNRYKGIKPAVQHYAQYLAKLVDEDKLKFNKRVEVIVTYHDPCYLGRHNNVYDEPRKVIESIPGVKLVEMDRNMRRSLCCEGGGGRMWYEGPPGTRLSELRILEALDVNANILITTCPFCLANFEDAVKTVGKEEQLKVMDLAELVIQAL